MIRAFRLTGSTLAFVVAVCLLVTGPATGAPATQDTQGLATVAGKYEGVVSTPDGAIPVTAELRLEDGTLKGSMAAGSYGVTIASGTLEGDKLTLGGNVDGVPLSISGTFKDGTFEGTWSAGEDSGTLKMAKAAFSADPISGDWEGIVDTPDEQRPIALTMKLEGEKVSGQIQSAEGAMTFQSGSWTGGTLTLAFPFATGDMITMVGTLQEGGRLAGTLDIAGQMQFGWAAQKKAK